MTMKTQTCSRKSQGLARQLRLRVIVAMVTGVAGIAGVGATQARAQERVTVSTRDLDLSRQEGVMILRRRINRAVDTVCDDNGVLDLARMWAIRNCRREVAATTAPKVAQAIARYREQALANARRPGRIGG